MFTMIAAAALAAASAPTAPTADAQAPKPQSGQMSGMDHSKMDHSKMSGDCDCCKKGTDGKMECSMPKKADASSGQQGHTGH